MEENPTYYNLGGHSETIQIDYDPSRISYEELLDVFWDSHNPSVQQWSRQYMSIIFYHNEEQQRLAMETREIQEAKTKGKIFTDIVPASEFYLAEAYHQKYYLRQIPELVKEFIAIYPDPNDFISSTAVARVNGYAGGYGTHAALQEELNNFGLSAAGKNKLLEIADRGLVPGCPLPQVAHV